MSKWRSLVSVLVLSVLIAAGSLSGIVAQEGGSGIQISPTRNEISINPGELKTISIFVKNVTNGDILVKTFLNDFESDDQSGDPKLLTDTTNRTTSSLDKFIRGLQDFELKAGESKDVQITIDAPGDIPPGGYFGALRFAALPKDGSLNNDERQVALTASVASLALVEVSGDITEQIQVKSVRALRDKTIGTFFTSQPNKVAIEIQNNGNSFSKPFGRIEVKRGNTEVYSYELNNKDPKANILPSSSRTFTDEVSNVNKPGRYTVIANVSHGRGGEIITLKSSFWYVPTWLILTTVAALIAVLAVGYMVFKNKSRRNSNRDA